MRSVRMTQEADNITLGDLIFDAFQREAAACQIREIEQLRFIRPMIEAHAPRLVGFATTAIIARCFSLDCFDVSGVTFSVSLRVLLGTRDVLVAILSVVALMVRLLHA
jgi:hypothetical protein